MSWIVGGIAYDVAKWTVKKGIEGIKDAHRISQNAEANRIRYQNDPEFRKQCDAEWETEMYRDRWD